MSFLLFWIREEQRGLLREGPKICLFLIFPWFIVICQRVYSTIVVGQSYYSVGKKYCRRRECYFVTPKVFCECCGMQLRASPHCVRMYEEKVGAKKNWAL